LVQVDALIAGRTRNRSPRANRTHLSSGFVKCGLCGTGVVTSGSLTSGAGNVTYCCDKMRGRRCGGIGYRSERAVDEAVLRALAPLVTEEVVERACSIAREGLEAAQRADTRASEMDRLRRELAGAEKRCRNVGDALAEAEAAQRADLLARHREEIKRRDGARAALADADRATPSVDAGELVGQLRARVTELRATIERGGAEARSAVEAILGGAHFVAMPVLVDGKKRWDLRARIAGGYLYSAAGAALPSLCAPQKRNIKGSLDPATAAAIEALAGSTPPVATSSSPLSPAPTPVVAAPPVAPVVTTSALNGSAHN
jgi:hypothetical protein